MAGLDAGTLVIEGKLSKGIKMEDAGKSGGSRVKKNADRKSNATNYKSKKQSRA